MLDLAGQGVAKAAVDQSYFQARQPAAKRPGCFCAERFAGRTARSTTTGALLTSPACFADAHQYSRRDQSREPGNPDDRRANRRTHSVSGFVGAILGTRASDRVVGAHLIHARGAGRATAGRSVAPAENTTSPPGGTCRKWGLGIGCKELARSRALSTGLSIAYFRSLGLPSLFGAVSATSRPPCTDPYARWCGAKPQGFPLSLALIQSCMKHIHNLSA